MTQREQPTPESILQRLQNDLAALAPDERERCQQMLLSEVIEGLHRGKVLEVGSVIGRLEADCRAERAKNSRRSRPENKERNDQIRAARELGMSCGKIAKLYGTTPKAVQQLLARDKKRARRSS